MDWADLLHLNGDELKSLLKLNVINISCYWWAVEHLSECRSCRERLQLIVDKYWSENDHENSRGKDETYEILRKEIREIMEIFLKIEKEAKVIPLKRKPEDNKK